MHEARSLLGSASRCVGKRGMCERAASGRLHPMAEKQFDERIGYGNDKSSVGPYRTKGELSGSSTLCTHCPYRHCTDCIHRSWIQDSFFFLHTAVASFVKPRPDARRIGLFTSLTELLVAHWQDVWDISTLMVKVHSKLLHIGKKSKLRSVDVTLTEGKEHVDLVVAVKLCASKEELSSDMAQGFLRFAAQCSAPLQSFLG